MENELKPLVLNPPLNITFIKDLEGLNKLFIFLQDQSKSLDTTTGFDMETDPKKDYYFRKCRTIQFGHIKEQFVVDLLGLCDNDPDLLFEAQGNYGKNLHKAPKLKQFIDELTYYVNGNLLLCGVNLGFEFSTMYWNFGIAIWNFFDVSITERCIYAGLHSLKDYGFYGMEELVARYFGYQIDKELQTSFTLDLPLSWPQVEYAALDTRLPIAIKSVQELIIRGETVKTLESKGRKGYARLLSKLNPLILGDNLEEISKIENNAVPPFIMMHIHGERLDTAKWMKRVNENKEKLKNVLKQLDSIFVPLVGSKNEAIDDKLIENLEQQWKDIRDVPTDDEINLKLHIKQMKKAMSKPGWIGQTETLMGYEFHLAQLEITRKEKKEAIKKECSELKKKRTKINNLKEMCEGEALINYGSDSQLLHCITENFKQLSKLEKLDDEVLEKYENYEVIRLIREYHRLSKLIGTYGESWCNAWFTSPTKEEGWLNPGDNRLHSIFSQMDAETGRSTSSQPNGQNLPQSPEIRSCFIADPPDENYPDGYKLITIDFNGAELRILAEEANDPIWINAFNRNEDVHSVCTELIEGDNWKAIASENCAYYKLNNEGEPQHFKCKCEIHNKLRNSMKPTNFGLPYGIGPRKLSQQIGKTYQETLELMAKHKQHFPNIWSYLEKSGEDSKTLKKSFDMFGRRRLLPEPTWEIAQQRLLEDEPDTFKIPQEQIDKALSDFETLQKRKPNKQELFTLEHRAPNAKEISKKFKAMYGNIERQGKNHRIQSANATIIKLCMGAGSDQNGKPFLFHILPKYDAKFLKMVHDEMVIQVPAIYAGEVASVVADAIERAAAMKMKKVKMTSEYHIADHWEK